MATTNTANTTGIPTHIRLPSSPSTTNVTTPHASFYHRVSHPEDILETLIRASKVFAEHECRLTIHVQDVERALASMHFTLPPRSSKVAPPPDESFRSDVWQLVNDRFREDRPFTDKALGLLQLVETEYQNKNTSILEKGTPTKGGRLLKLESPTGVSVGFFEYDWSREMQDKTVADDENEEDEAEWNDDRMEVDGAAQENDDDSSDDESIIRRAMLVDEEDDEYKDELEDSGEPWFTVVKDEDDEDDEDEIDDDEDDDDDDEAEQDWINSVDTIEKV